MIFNKSLPMHHCLCDIHVHQYEEIKNTSLKNRNLETLNW